MRCWYGAQEAHEHLCGGGMGFHPGYLLPVWHLAQAVWRRLRP